MTPQQNVENLEFIDILNGHLKNPRFSVRVQSLKELNFTSLTNLESLGRSPKGAPSETDRLEELKSA